MSDKKKLLKLYKKAEKQYKKVKKNVSDPKNLLDYTLTLNEIEKEIFSRIPKYNK